MIFVQGKSGGNPSQEKVHAEN
ncbi:hypothetical protein M8C21_000128 [Ambrosia artemisiifolia]|uniref:Uncharacterized protein n=1 Tax=Ambrosia artemisiifolia TaxID=4212 RepID=A0AAD5GS03_AMBAR|nr:hypothetical protein M8C21_000128 [Ambrosia artemisiifolia]